MIYDANDIVHFYLGSLFQFTWKNGETVVAKLDNINSWGSIFATNTDNSDDYYEIDNFRQDGVLKLILHHPSNMTNIQKKAYYKAAKIIYTDNKRMIIDTPESLLYLFAHSIDAFDLIDRNKAICANRYHKNGQIVEELPSEPKPFQEEVFDSVIKSTKPYEFYVHPEDRIKEPLPEM